jgi:hypothetical protein
MAALSDNAIEDRDARGLSARNGMQARRTWIPASASQKSIVLDYEFQ